MEKTQTGKVIKIQERMSSFGLYSIVVVRGDDGKKYSYIHGRGFFNHYDGEDHMDDFEDAVPVNTGDSVRFLWDFDKSGKYRNISNISKM